MISSASALSDANVTFMAQGTGLCMSVDIISNMTCDNQTVSVDGTSDHIVYYTVERLGGSGGFGDRVMHGTETIFNDVLGKNIFSILMMGIILCGAYVFKKLIIG